MLGERVGREVRETKNKIDIVNGMSESEKGGESYCGCR